MTISGGSSLPKEDIERMMREAEEHAEEDRKRRDEVEVRNAAESAVYGTEKFLAENGDKLPAANKTEVEDALAELKTAVDSNDVGNMKSAAEKLAQVSQTAGAAIYQQASAAGADGGAGGQQPGGGSGGSAGGADGGAGSADDDVVDAEIVDEDESK